ncbi:MAG: hypothetical protein WC356_02295 [Candidatus Micrarchaeia archaeon]|jgi:hypothetical protein
MTDLITLAPTGIYAIASSIPAGIAASSVNAASLIVEEKYTDSYRINHSDFADVCKTTYAKGVIGDGGDGSTAFYWENNLPTSIIIWSSVKVEGDWGVSDYIPLFYHSRPHYWDVSGALATDFNNNALLSFRCGDEVKVLLQDGIPQYVMGFYDGIPRVGENIFNISGSGGSYSFSMFTGTISLSGPTDGPDGLDLGLTEQIQLLFEETTDEGIIFLGYKAIIGPILVIVIIRYYPYAIEETIYYKREIYLYCSVGNYYPELWDNIVSYDTTEEAYNNNKLYRKEPGQVYPDTVFAKEELDSPESWDLYVKPHNSL